ncbi:MAG: hypothetical protein B6I17_04065 [Tenericutes bacterium 4572_104]|nr:MAG: hypothetical protein B6I17_04065 [Tenericutes bacterium 4572_104]
MDLRLPRLNKIVVSGRLTRDGELRYTSTGTAIFNCGIAIDEGYWDKQSNQWVNQPIFMNVSLWGLQAERMSALLKKGSPVVIEGGLRQSSYTTKDGQNRTTTEIRADKIQSLEIVNRGDNGSYNNGQGSSYNNNSGQTNNYNNNNSNQQPDNQNRNQNSNQSNTQAQPKRPEPDFINDDVPF